MGERTFTLHIEGSSSRERARNVAEDWVEVVGVNVHVVSVEFEEEEDDGELWTVMVNRDLTEAEQARL